MKLALGIIITLILASLLLYEAGEVRAVLLNATVPELGSTREVGVARGYVIFNNFTISNSTGGLASTDIDTVVTRFYIYYAEDAGNYTLFEYVNNTGQFEFAFYINVTFPDNQTVLIVTARLAQSYPQGAEVYAYADVKKNS